jgi:hypothetical protein
MGSVVVEKDVRKADRFFYKHYKVIVGTADNINRGKFR